MSERTPKTNTGARRLYAAWRASVAGFRYVLEHEEAFRLELGLALAAPLTAFLISGNGLSALIVFTAFLLLMLTEVVNTAIEVVVDRISLERHPLSGAAKDMGSLAVLIATVNAAIWWLYAAFAL